MAKVVDGIRFAELKAWEVCFIESIEVDSMFITDEQVKQVKSVLMLEGKSLEELNEIRNSVVKHLGDKSSAARAANDWKSFDKFHNAMSGITYVIDSLIYTYNM